MIRFRRRALPLADERSVQRLTSGAILGAAWGPSAQRRGVALLALAVSACAPGATLGSGVGERLVGQPPYYAGSAPAGSVRTIARLPITYQHGAAQDPLFDLDPASSGELGALLREMNAYLDSLDVLPLLAADLPARAVAPDVQFGCDQDVLGDCESESRDISRQGKPWMRLAVARPSAGWVAAVRAGLDGMGAEGALLITVEIGQYWVHQRNLRGQKEVRLGTGYSAQLPWLTSLDRPVQVVQLTGALVDRDGRAIRIGAEGMLARRTHLLLSSIGAQALITDDDIGRLRGQRRDDHLPENSLVWQVALRNLVAELTGQPGLRR